MYWPDTQTDLKPLKRVTRLNPESLSETTNPDFRFDYIDIGSVVYGKGITTKQAVTFSDAPSRARKLVRENDLIISTVRTYLRAIARIGREDNRNIASTGFAVCRPVSGVDPTFLFYAVHSQPFIEEVVARSTGISYPAINPSTLGDIKLPIPSEEDQVAIARFLDHETGRIDGLIEKKTRFIALLKEKRAADIIEAISPKEGWNRFPFWSVAKSKSISGRPDEGLLSVYLDRGVIPYSEGGGLVHKPAESLEKYQLVEPGDLVMNNQQAWRGSLGVSLHRGIVSPAYLVLKLDREKIDPTFANYMFRARPYVEKFMLASMSVGDIQRQIKWPHLRIVPVVVPSVTEQREIAERLDSEEKRIDDLITLTKRSIDLLREKRAALITAAVTGKIDVRRAA